MSCTYIINVTFLLRSSLSIVKGSSIHRLKLGSENYFISPIELRCFTTLNAIQLQKYVHDIVCLKCCLEWAANESDFCTNFEDVRHQINDGPSFY